MSLIIHDRTYCGASQFQLERRIKQILREHTDTTDEAVPEEAGGAAKRGVHQKLSDRIPPVKTVQRDGMDHADLC